jgi:hypothetical protein
VSTGAIAALRAGGQAGWIARSRGASGAVGLVLGLLLAARWGVNGALAGLAAAESGFALAAWLRFNEMGVSPVGFGPAGPDPAGADAVWKAVERGPGRVASPRDGI